MRPLRFSINVTVDGCADHQVGVPDAELHRHSAETIARADALIFGRVVYGMMEGGWRKPSETGVLREGMPDWMMPFARVIGPAKKYVVSDTLDAVGWNTEVIRGADLGSRRPPAEGRARQGPLRRRRDLSAGARQPRLDR